MSVSKARNQIQANVIAVVFSIAAIVVILISFFINKDETQNLLRLIGFGLILATIMFRVFNETFSFGAAREEIEKKMFDYKNQEK